MRDLLNERMRYYRYPDDFTHAVEKPVAVNTYDVGDGMVHEIRDALGRFHIIQPGWRILTILPPKEETAEGQANA